VFQAGALLHLNLAKLLHYQQVLHHWLKFWQLVVAEVVVLIVLVVAAVRGKFNTEIHLFL
jgi:hypothetical protein